MYKQVANLKHSYLPIGIRMWWLYGVVMYIYTLNINIKGIYVYT